MGHLLSNFMVGLMVTSSKRAYATGYVTQVAVPRTPAPAAGHFWPVPPQESQTQVWLSLCGVSGSWCTQVLFEPSKHLWRVWGLIPNMILPLPPFCWGFSFVIGCGLSFFGEIHHSPFDGCSAASCNFGVLTWEDECTSSYSTTLLLILSISDFFIKVSSMNHQKWLRFPTLLITDTVDNLMYCCCLFYFACACEGGNWKMPRIFT